MNRRPVLLLCLIALTSAPSAAGAAGGRVDYLRDVKPLLKHHCYAATVH
jgi:hypothetical protein